MNWKAIKRFCFTYALPDGAWLEDDSGNRHWYSFATIAGHMGQNWANEQLRKLGWNTGPGHWVNVDNQAEAA